MTTHTISLPDGRTLAVDDIGNPAGRAVLFLHPAPGSRVFDPDPDATRRAGIRLVTVDRPGYGGSSPLPDGTAPSVAAMADDMAAAVAALGIRDCAVVGWSKGGRVALGLAARHPDLVGAVALVGTPAPDEEVPWIPDEHRPMLAALAKDPGGAVAALAPMFAGMGDDMAAAVGSVAAGPADDAVLADPARRARVEAMLAEAFRWGGVGVATDIVAADALPPGFDVAAVGAPVALWYGDADVNVPPAHATWWAGALAESTIHVVPGAGHLLALTAWGDILASLGNIKP
ncbi:MAG: hypothetical protein JWN29_231 [Acidimicrobiales bacterium]|nr:hypothetical protein [Acidimicrobiales bacterium]